MRNDATPPLSLATAPSSSASISRSSGSARSEPTDLSTWVQERLDTISQRWHQDLRARGDASAVGLNGLMESFLELLVSFLPGLLGPYREQVQPLWTQTAELFGATAARRGLAAGEVIEEFQVLRESIIRLLYQDPPRVSGNPISLRDLLRLSRAVDRGVTHASVGHTDALFFALFEGSGVPDTKADPHLVDEVQAQMAELRRAYREVMEPLRHHDGES